MSRRESVRDPARREALRRLWEDVCRGLEVRHPDPEVTVSVYVDPDTLYEGYITINMRMWNLHNTDDLEKRWSCRSEWEYEYTHRRTPQKTFTTCLRTAVWPGKALAEIAILGAWSVYVQHETFELFTRAGKLALTDRLTVVQERVIDPHGVGLCDHLNDTMDRCFYQQSMEDLVATIGLAIGKKRAEQEFQRAALEAALDVDAEARWIRDGGEWQ